MIDDYSPPGSTDKSKVGRLGSEAPPGTKRLEISIGAKLAQLGPQDKARPEWLSETWQVHDMRMGARVHYRDEGRRGTLLELAQTPGHFIIRYSAEEYREAHYQDVTLIEDHLFSPGDKVYDSMNCVYAITRTSR